MIDPQLASAATILAGLAAVAASIQGLVRAVRHRAKEEGEFKERVKGLTERLDNFMDVQGQANREFRNSILWLTRRHARAGGRSTEGD